MKWLLGMFMVLVTVGMATAIMFDGQGVKDFTAKYKGGEVRVNGQYVDNSDNPMKNGWLDVYCSHDEETFLLGSYEYSLHRTFAGFGDMFHVSSAETPCYKNDVAWIEVNDWLSHEVNIKKKGHPRVIIPTPEEVLIECKAEAKEWYEVHEEDRFSKILYFLKVMKCKYEYKKDMCALDDTKEWKRGRCRNIVIEE